MTHVVLTLPAHHGLGRRQAVYDSAVLAGLLPLAVVSQPVANLSWAGREPDTCTAPQFKLFVEWGAGSCSVSLGLFPAQPPRPSATKGKSGAIKQPGAVKWLAICGDDSLGGLCLDRQVASLLASKLSGAEVASVDLTSRHSLLALSFAVERLKIACQETEGDDERVCHQVVPPSPSRRCSPPPATAPTCHLRRIANRVPCPTIY